MVRELHHRCFLPRRFLIMILGLRMTCCAAPNLAKDLPLSTRVTVASLVVPFKWVSCRTRSQSPSPFTLFGSTATLPTCSSFFLPLRLSCLFPRCWEQVMSATLTRQPSFLDFISGGCELRCVLAWLEGCPGLLLRRRKRIEARGRGLHTHTHTPLSFRFVHFLPCESALSLCASLHRMAVFSCTSFFSSTAG